MISYINETDTLESVAMRVQSMSPIAASIPANELKLAFLYQPETVPVYFKPEHNTQGLDDHIKGSDESLWSYLSRLYSDITLSVQERKIKLQHQNIHRGTAKTSVIPAYFPLAIGIERVTISAVNAPARTEIR